MTALSIETLTDQVTISTVATAVLCVTLIVKWARPVCPVPPEPVLDPPVPVDPPWPDAEPPLPVLPPVSLDEPWEAQARAEITLASMRTWGTSLIRRVERMRSPSIRWGDWRIQMAAVTAAP